MHQCVTVWGIRIQWNRVGYISIHYHAPVCNSVEDSGIVWVSVDIPAMHNSGGIYLYIPSSAIMHCWLHCWLLVVDEYFQYLSHKHVCMGSYCE